MADSPSTSRRKPSKPYLSFPLTAHNNGQWCKKIRGKIHFFGTWDDPQAALKRYLRVAEDLHAGRQPRISTGEITVKDLCNEFLTHQLHKQQAGQISLRWFEDCRRVLEHFAGKIGASRAASELRPPDFMQYRQLLSRAGLAGKKGLGVHAMTRTLTIIRGMFKYAYENDVMERPAKFGSAFDRPSARLRRKEQRQTRMKNGKPFFSVQEINSLLEHAGLTLRAMILLGVNGGFGNSDCASLPTQAIDFQRGVIEFD
ncbi:MAG: hypothetical protein ACOC9S_04155, partial [Planctomycetota bacterium]